MKTFFSFKKKQNKVDPDIHQGETPMQKEGLFLSLSLKDRILFIKQLSILIKAGIPLFKSLHMLKEQTRSRSMKKIMNSVIRDIENGQYLATSLGKFKKVFGELTINIIAVGEISGSLSDNLNHLAVILKKRQTLRRKVIGASVYPIFIILATLAITVMLTVFVFPKIIPVLKSINYQLPITTRALIFASDLMKNHGLLVFGIGVAFIVIFFLLLKIKKFHYGFDKTLLYIPFIKQFVQSYNVTNICRTMGLLLNSGITIVRSFQIAANTTTNLVYKKELNGIADKIMEGEIVSQNMKKNNVFPLMVSQMVTVGETTGKLSETFTYLADIYEEEIDDMTKNLSNTIEPLLLIFMGVLVGFIAVSIITPIYGITQHLTPR